MTILSILNRFKTFVSLEDSFVNLQFLGIKNPTVPRLCTQQGRRILLCEKRKLELRQRTIKIATKVALCRQLVGISPGSSHATQVNQLNAGGSHRLPRRAATIGAQREPV